MTAAVWLVHRYDAPAIPREAAEQVWNGDHGDDQWRRRAAFVLAVHESVSDPAPFLEAFLEKLTAGLKLPEPLRAKIGAELGIGHNETTGLCALRLRTPEELAGWIKDRFAGRHGSRNDYSFFGGLRGNESLLWLQETADQPARRKMAETLPYLANGAQRLHVAALSGLKEETQAALKELRASTKPEDAVMAAHCALAAGDVSRAYDAWKVLKQGVRDHPWPESEAAFMALMAWSVGWEVPKSVLESLRAKQPADLTRSIGWNKSQELLPLMLNGATPTPSQSMKVLHRWRPVLRLMAGTGQKDRAVDLVVVLLRKAVAASFEGWKPEDRLTDFTMLLPVSGLSEPAWERLKDSPDTEARWAAGWLASYHSSGLKDYEATEALLKSLAALQPRCPLLTRHLER
jgi:hypothetical protein